ncbi:hypothetical protein EGW08_015163 [Elysia chlorotica]|uniref:Uncharacterized protein n=1 Tax=Elysia chlorotica TaxID=188477 RepID=A0A3S0ZKN5_ELYCH|nr:hypothetical protein EGW08_015163 [Elysia chlorotica]
MSESSMTLEDLNDSSSQSYVIVQEQMRDLVSIQEATICNLVRTNVETLNASRDIFNSTLEAKEEKIDMLQKSIAEDFVAKKKYTELLEKIKKDFVPKADFDDLQQQIQDECERHSETQIALDNVNYQLKESFMKIKSIEEEAKKERDTFVADERNLKDQLSEAHARNNLLQSKLNEQQMLCEQQQDEIKKLCQQVENLQLKKHSQKQKLRQQLHESEVEKQQEAYLQRMIADMGRKSHKKY